LRADCVSAFDSFRAPLTAEDHCATKSLPIDAEGSANNSSAGGIPYVMEDFRFPHDADGAARRRAGATHLTMLRRSFSAFDLRHWPSTDRGIPSGKRQLRASGIINHWKNSARPRPESLDRSGLHPQQKPAVPTILGARFGHSDRAAPLMLRGCLYAGYRDREGVTEG